MFLKWILFKMMNKVSMEQVQAQPISHLVYVLWASTIAL